MWSPFDLFRRRLTSAARPAKAKRKTAARSWQPSLEILEDRCVPTTSSISANFNPGAIAAGDTLWFNAAAGISGVGATTADIFLTNQTITFSDTNGGVTTPYTLNVPNAELTMVPGGTTATTTFNTSTNSWLTVCPTGLAGNKFLDGYAMALPSGLGGGDNNVTWSGTFSSDTAGLNVSWAWGAAVYTTFSTAYSSLGVKPCDDATHSSYLNSDTAGSPESYKSHVATGATGTGGTNYTGNLGGNTGVTPNGVSLAGTVYNDVNANGVFDGSDTGISGVTLTLTGTTTGGQSVNTTTTTAGNGTYSFLTSNGTNLLVAGTYQITESAPSGDLAGTDNLGTVNGTTDGTVSAPYVIGSIALTAGASGTGYNFGELVPIVSSSQANFSNTAIAPGRTIWFSSVASVTGVGTYPATIYVTNQVITFSDTKSGVTTPYSLSVPNAQLTLTPGATTATTTFNSTTSTWITNAPSGLGGNLFLAGYEMALPSGLGGNDQNVTWTGTFTTDTSGLSLQWSWGAAVYSSFNTTYSSLGVKPCDSNTADASYPNNDKAGTPESYKTHVVTGATGNGGTNYTGNLSGNQNVTPRYTPVYVSISGTSYNDTNVNGVYDAGDTGLSGITLNLTGTTTGGQTETATTTTSSTGAYTFSTDSNGNRIPAGTYQITEVVPTGYYQGNDTVGTVNGVSDGTKTSLDQVGSITLATGQSGTGYNFGQINPFQLVTSPYPYVSSNPNTDIAFNESEIMAGATVNLATNTFDIFYTDEHAMTLGVNQVSVTAPNGTTTTTNYSVTPLSSDPGSATNPSVGDKSVTGAQAATDSSGRPLFPSLFVTDVTSNPSSTSGDWQFGGTAIAPTGIYGSWKTYAISVNETTTPWTITDTGANDPTANGTNLGTGADPMPAAIAANNAGYMTEVQWNLNSLYNSGTLIPGHSYRLYFIVHDGDQNKTGGDVGQALYDFTYEGPATIAGNVYNDVHGTGAYAAGDTGLSGVTLTLTGTSAEGLPVTAVTTTAANGSYTFTTDSNGNVIRGGTYTITETAPSGYLLGSSTVGTINGGGIGTASSATSIGSIVIADGQSGVNYNFGDVLPVTLGGTVYKDINGSGSLVAGDPGIGGVTLTLTGTNGLNQAITATATTAGDGTYGFSTDSNGHALRPGTYQITESQPGGYVAGATAVGTVSGTSDGTIVAAGQIGSIGLTSGQAGINYNFGDVQPVTIAGTVYLDGNANGVLDSGETGIAGVTLTLSGTNGMGNAITATATTAADGTYSFSTDSNGHLLLPGTYLIVETPPASGYLQGVDTVGTVNGTADGTLTAVDQIGSIVVTSGQNGIHYNFGFVTPVTIAGLVYQDMTGSGALVAGDPGMANVTVTLSGTNNLGLSITATTTTAADGTYSFSTDSNGKLLAPGTYQITGTTPTGFVPIAANVGTVNGTVDGTETTPSQTSAVVLASGQSGVNYDFGLSVPAAISGYVYADLNHDQTLDPSDPGIAGQTVSLVGITASGASVSMTTTTSSIGYYIFTGLMPGTYSVSVNAPQGVYRADVANVGTVNGTTIGVATTDLEIDQVQLSFSNTGLNYDFGFTRFIVA